MKPIFASLLLCLTLSFQAKSQATLTLDSTVLMIDTLATGLDIPWEIKWGPDNKIWATERFGRLTRVDPTNGNKETLLDISANNGGPVYQASESGLLGMAFHPDFADSPYVYLVYNYQSGGTREKLVRYTYANDTLTNEVAIIDNVRGNTFHDGSRLAISPDRHLYMTTGDAGDVSLPQNTGSVNGKILRFNLNGSIPSDNPIPGSAIWTWGHRNPQGLVWAPNGILYSSEHGPNSDDELNIIEKARNYGWPDVYGYCDGGNETTFCADSNVHEPIAAWTPTIAPGDVAWYENAAIPEWSGCLLMVVMKDKKLKRFQLSSDGRTVTSQTDYFTNQFGRLRDVLVSPDGRVFLATNGESSSNTDPNTHVILEVKNSNYTAVKNVNANIDWQVFPNPASGTVNLKAQLKSNSQCTVTIYDAVGRMVYQQDLGMASSVNSSISLRGFSAGFYSLALRVGDEVSYRKLVVE